MKFHLDSCLRRNDNTFMLKKIHLLITGNVQGVFYRVNTKNKADELSLTGWVKNISDGKVEIFAEGEEKNLKEFIKWCYNGSEGARVDEVKVEWRDISKGEFEKFEILL